MKTKKISFKRLEKFRRNKKLDKKNKPKLKKKEIILKIFSMSAIFFVLMIVIGIIGMISAVVIYNRNLPAAADSLSRSSPETTQIFDRNGKLLYALHGNENRIPVTLDKVSKNMQWAMLAAENIHFYEDQTGVDPVGIVRSVIFDVLHRGSSLEGASTITQQLVKDTLLTKNQTLERKIKEVILTVQVSQKFSKQEILQAYLNEIPFGGTVYGIQTAAQTYFGVNADQLDLAQSALLAGLPQAPSYYSPIFGGNADAAVIRQHYVLDQMLKYKDLTGVTSDQITAAKAEVLHYNTAAANQPNKLAPHFVDYVIQQLDTKYGQDYVQNSGLKIYTTLDYNMQQLAQQAVTNAVDYFVSHKLNAHNGALTTIDATNGEIMTMVGSYKYGVDLGPKMEGDTNVTLSDRQPGSSIKPLLYATAFQNLGMAPATLMPDIPININGYSPADWNGRYEGPESIRKAIEGSRNVPAVETLYSVGPSNFVDEMKKFGYKNLDSYRNDMSIAIGSISVPLLTHTEAYAPFSNGGTLYPQQSVLKILDKDDKVLYQYDPSTAGKSVIDPRYTYMITDVLKHYDTLSLAPSTTAAGFNFAAKDGTSDNNIDLELMGYSPKYVTGMWLGNNDNTTTTGNSWPWFMASFWNKYMMQINASYKNLNFTKPANVVEENVCSDSGLLANSSIQCPTTSEIFSISQLPKVDDTHVSVKVCKEDQTKLATQNQINSGDYVDKVFINLKTFSSYFQPSFTTYLQNNHLDYLAQTPPTDYCSDNGTTTNSGGNSSVSFISPASSSTFDAGSNIQIQVNVNDTQTINNVVFVFDGQSISGGTVSNTPYSVSFQIPTNATQGSHVITATATDSSGTQLVGSETIQVGSSTANQVVTNGSVNVTSPTNGTSFHETQTNISFSGNFSNIPNAYEVGFYLLGGNSSGKVCSISNVDESCTFKSLTVSNSFSFSLASWSGFVGSYSLYAYVKTSDGTKYSSSPVSIVINNP